MRMVTILLGAGFGVSSLFNMVLYGKLARIQEAEQAFSRARPRDSASAGAPARYEPRPAPRAEAGDPSDLVEEVRQLRRDVAALRGNADNSPGTPPSADVPADLPAWLVNDPAVARALEERAAQRQASRKYWTDMERVMDLKASVGVPKARELAAKLTAEYLGLDGGNTPAFMAASIQASQEIERADAERRDSIAKVKATNPDRDTRKRLEDEIDARYDQVKKTSLSRLDPYLGADPRHQELKSRLSGRWWDFMRAR